MDTEKNVKESMLYRFGCIRYHSKQHLAYYFENFYRSQKVLYIHIPKTGGTSISKAIYDKEDHHFSARELAFFYPREFKEYYKFSMVRHPFDRIVSMYKYIRKYPQLETFQQLDIPDTFRDFVMDFLRPKVIKYQYFFWSQKAYLCNHLGSIGQINFIGRYENFDESLHYIKSVVNTDKFIPWENKSSTQVLFDQGLEKELRRKVYELYRSDYHLFDYKPYS